MTRTLALAFGIFGAATLSFAIGWICSSIERKMDARRIRLVQRLWFAKRGYQYPHFTEPSDSLERGFTARRAEILYRVPVEHPLRHDQPPARPTTAPNSGSLTRSRFSSERAL